MWLAAVIIEPTYWCKWQSASIKIMHIHSKLCITVRICVFFSQYFLKNKYHHCDWWQTKYSNLHLRLFTAAFSYSFHIYCTYCSLNLTCKSFKMIVVWVLVCFSFNNAKWAQVHMDLFLKLFFKHGMLLSQSVSSNLNWKKKESSTPKLLAHLSLRENWDVH